MGEIFRTNDPTQYDDVDGIIIDESAPAPNISGVAANIAIMVGQFQRGVENELTDISSIGVLHELFGQSDARGNKALKNKKFGRLRVIRVVASDSAKATVTLQDETPADSIKFEALYKGVYGNSIQYKVEAGTSSGKKYTFKDNNSNSVLPIEVYDNVVVTGKTQVQLDELFAGSKLIKPVAIPAVDEPANVATFTGLASGSDGTIADTDYESAIAVAEQERAGNVLFTDYYTSSINGYLKAHLTNAPDKLVIVAPASSEDEDTTTSASTAKSNAITDVDLNRDAEGSIIYAFNPIKTRINGVVVNQSAAPWIASIISLTAPHIDPAYAANVQFTLGGLDTKYKYNRNDYIAFKEAGIAAFELDKDLGIKLRSGISTQIVNSSKVTILRKRMAYFLTDSIALFLKNYQNDVNSFAKRTAVNAAIVSWDDGLIRDEILPGDAEVKTGKARLVDTESLNTDDSIAAGKFILLYKRRIYSSMRFIVLKAEIGESVVVTEA